jgi:ABC-type branched-subunit amino acid transport system substrate-binding protein
LRAAPLLAALVLALLACRTPPVSEGDRQAYHSAIRLLAQNPEAGAAALREFVAERPKSALADDAALRLAESRIEEGDDDEAVRRLGWILRHHPDGDKSDTARIVLARLQRARGHVAVAYRTAQTIRLPLLSSGQREQALRLLADLAAQAGDRAGRLRWLARLRGDQSDETKIAAIDAELESALVELAPEELDAIARELGRAVPAGRVRLRQAELAYASGDADAAARFLATASELPLTPADAERLTAFEAALQGGPAPGFAGGSSFPSAVGARGTLGVVLPLSGEFASAGQGTLEGILLASGVLEGARPGAAEVAPPGGGLKLRVRDTAGVPDRAAAAVRELAGDPNVVAVLGPLTAEEAQAAAADADRLGVPMITLTRHEEVAVGHPNVFRIGLTPGAEADRLAEYAASTLALHRVGILHPQDAYGERMRALFGAALEARGVSVVGVASYDVEATDFSEAVKSLIRSAGGTPVDPTKPPAVGAEPEEPTGPPPVPGGFDAVFVPDAHRAIGLIAPALAFAGIRGVRLLGTSAWNDPGLLTVGREHVEGAVFTGSVVRESESPMLAEFARRFRGGFGRVPDALSALGFDAAFLALHGLVTAGASRDALRNGLRNAPPLQGVSGTTDFVTDGNALRRPYLLGVEGGRIVDLDDLHRPPRLPGQAPESEPTLNLSL